MLLLIAGDSVMHAKFGLGTVQSTMGSGSKSEAIVDFGEEFGTRHLVLRYAPMQKLSGPAVQVSMATEI
jgi:DNA helicase II / ATP-dependent DNA helicase PcrA